MPTQPFQSLLALTLAALLAVGCSSQRTEPRGGSLLGGLNTSHAGTGGSYWYRAIRVADLSQADIDALYDALAATQPGEVTTVASADASASDAGVYGYPADASATPPHPQLVTADTDGDGLVTPDEVLGMFRTGYSRAEILRALRESENLYLVMDRRDAQRLIEAGLPRDLVNRMRAVSSGQRADLAQPRDAASVETPF